MARTLTHAGDAAYSEQVKRAHSRLEGLTGVSVPLRLWDGTELGPRDAAFRIVLAFPWSLRAMLLPPSDLTAGEAYVRGDVDIEGDIEAAMGLGERFDAADLGMASRLRMLSAILRLPKPPHRTADRRARLKGRLHTRERDRAAIAFHYDLPQRFYETFLDAQLVYSCAYFADDDEDLGRAQTRKLDLVCRKLRLEPGMRLLDIGCGWGSLLAHAARHYGVRGVGVTLSETQTQAGRRRLAEQGLSDRVEIRLQDYRDLDETFDAVASIGMVEHVGPDHLPEYMATAYRLVAEGGLFLNHGIVVGDPHHVRRGTERTFVTAYVFPDGGLVPAWHAVREIEQGGFEVLDVEQLRPHYALTLRQWIRRLEAGREQAVSAASEVEYRIWRAYMAGSAHSFAGGSLGVIQVLGSKGARAPLGRAWMTPRHPQG